MPIDAAHKSRWQIGEVVFGIPLLAGITLQFLAPISYTNLIFKSMFMIIGFILCAAGASLIIATRHVFSTYSQPTDPGSPTSRLMTTGAFSISRNPMYLGAVCLLVGIALIFDLVWVFIFILPTFVASHLILIEPEERYLAVKFGVDYRNYSNSVSRWIGRKSG